MNSWKIGFLNKFNFFSSNIFLNGGSIVIGDLGLAKSIDELKSSKTFAGSINYVSPEIINKEKYKFEVDIW